MTTATITNAATLKSTLSVAGVSTFTGAANFTTAAFSGATTFSGAATFNDGLSAINGIFTDTITIGSGSTLATLAYTQAKTLVNLSSMNCNSNQALSESSSGNFICVNVADIPLVGKTVVPTCPPGEPLYFDASGFSCMALVPNCSGEYVTSNGSTFTCAAAPVIPAVPAVPNCTNGQYLTANGTSYSCYSPPSGGQPLFVTNATSNGQGQWNQYLAQEMSWYCIPQVEAQGDTPAQAQAYCAGFYNACSFNYGNPDGGDGQVTGVNSGNNNTAYNGQVANDDEDFSNKINNVVCMSSMCHGKTGINPALVYLTGSCSPGQTPGNSGNPSCHSDGTPIVSYSCLYSN